MGSFNYDFACTCTVYTYTKMTQFMRKSHLLRVYAVPDKIAVKADRQSCLHIPRGSQESNVLLVGIFSPLMRFLLLQMRSTYSNFKKWRFEIRSFGGIYSSGIPLRDIYEEAGL